MKRTIQFLRVISVLLLLSSIPLKAGPASAIGSTYVVDRVTDNNPGGGGQGTGLAGDLRYAITQAQSGDSIGFSVTGTIHLSNALPGLTKNITIKGPGANQLTVDGAGNRAFAVGSGTTIIIAGLSITGGVSNGGGIFNAGTLTLNEVVVSGNQAGDPTNGGGTGAGIWNYTTGALTLNSSTVSGNTVVGNSSYNPSRGGGIANYGKLDINNSTISGNTASEGSGAGISNTLATSTVTIRNSTVSSNSATGFVGVGGGIANHGTFKAVNTILAGNSASQSPDLFGPMTSLGHNLIGNTNGGSGYRSDLGDLLNVNPKLGALQNNGGSTRTMALLAGSPAMDEGDDTICAGAPINNLDQRGKARPQGAHCDIGSYEGKASTSIFIAHTHPYGWPLPNPAANDSNDDPMRGQVNNVVAPNTYDDFYVTCYVYVPNYPDISGESGWWIKPTYANPKTMIGNNGNWHCDVTTGGYDEYATIYRAYLFSSSLAAPPMTPPMDCTLPTCIDWDEATLDITPPETTIVSCPATLSFLKAVSFEFTSSHTGDVFHCQLDGGAAGSCSSPQSYSNLGAGLHEFSVYAEDRVGNIDSSPASCEWEIADSITVTSQAIYDGSILESREYSNTGGRLNPIALTLRVGDDAANRQYRAILSFDTPALPEGATITFVILRFKLAGISGVNPFTTHGKLLADICAGAYNGDPTLESEDFNSACGKNRALIFSNTKVGNWYSRSLSSLYFDYINWGGITQFRLRFKLGDDNDFSADFLRLYSGDSTEANRPQLVIGYYVP
jgi:hypothetical protein